MLLASTIALATAMLLGAETSVPACGDRPKGGWLAFVDNARGFCFWNPPIYSRRRAVGESDTGWRKLVVFVSLKMRRPFAPDKEPATLKVSLLEGAFDLHRLIEEAPTGYEIPPSPVRYGTNVFYRYTAGGGGVSYPDVYYFDLGGRTLRLTFDGPYADTEKSPDQWTRELEKTLLSSFKKIDK